MDAQVRDGLDPVIGPQNLGQHVLEHHSGVISADNDPDGALVTVARGASGVVAAASAPTLFRHDSCPPTAPTCLPAGVLAADCAASRAAASDTAPGSALPLLRSATRAARPREAVRSAVARAPSRSEEHTSELQSRGHLVCRLLLEKKNTQIPDMYKI